MKPLDFLRPVNRVQAFHPDPASAFAPFAMPPGTDDGLARPLNQPWKSKPTTRAVVLKHAHFLAMHQDDPNAAVPVPLMWIMSGEYRGGPTDVHGDIATGGYSKTLVRNIRVREGGDTADFSCSSFRVDANGEYDPVWSSGPIFNMHGYSLRGTPARAATLCGEFSLRDKGDGGRWEFRTQPSGALGSQDGVSRERVFSIDSPTTLASGTTALEVEFLGGEQRVIKHSAAAVRTLMAFSTGSGQTMPQNATRYIGLAVLTDTVNIVSLPAPVAGTLRNLAVKLSAAPGASQSQILHVFVNGIATAITVTISGAGATAGTDTTHTHAVNVGDLIEVRCVSSATAVATTVRAALVLQSAGKELYIDA